MHWMENSRNEHWFKWLAGNLAGLAPVLAGLCCLALAVPAMAGNGSSSQHRAAEEMLAAMASGDAAAMALAIHESELELLRKNLVGEMKSQADRNETLLRDRLFGSGLPLSDIERLTPQGFFTTLARRLRIGGRKFESVDWLQAVEDSGGMVQMVGRASPPKALGSVRVPVLVSIVPWGKDWKAAIPLELQAQIDDLRTGRTRVNTPAVAAGGAGAAPAGAAPAPSAPGAAPASSGGSPQALLQVLQAAEENLRASRCEEYYSRQMSPNFRRTTAAKALRALVTSCQSRAEIRERLLAAFTLARNVTPRFEYAGTRAIYDLRGQGLPFDTLVLEQVNRDWYIAE
jgi:hypothetical protein